eukprot:g78819.t1
MPAMDYVALDETGGVRAIRAAAGMLGLLLAGAAGWATAGTLAADRPQGASTSSALPTVPAEVVLRPGTPNPLLLFPLGWGGWGGPCALFLYNNPPDPHAARHPTSVEEAWLYGADLYALPKDGPCGRDQVGRPDTIATATGQAGDIVSGRLLTFPCASFQEVLREVDRARDFDPASLPHERCVERRVVQLMTADGKVANAHTYLLARTPSGIDAKGKIWTPGCARTAQEVVSALPKDALAGQTVFITGAYTGIGQETAKALLRAGAKVVVGGRNLAKQETWLAEVRNELGLEKERLTGLSLDLMDLASVQRCAQEFLSKHRRLDVLVNNAGIMMTPLEYSKQGYESQFAVNVLAHFLLTKLLLPALQHTAVREKGRVVFLSSMAHLGWGAKRFQHSWFQGEVPKGVYEPGLFYQQSKLGDILLAQEFSRRYGLEAAALHPGIIPYTELFRSLPKPVGSVLGLLNKVVKPADQQPAEAVANKKQPLKSLGGGAATTVTLVTAPQITPGGYYENCAEAVAHPSATNFPQDAIDLFELCDRLSRDFQTTN